MSDTEEPRDPERKENVSEEEAIAALLRLAGPRPAVPGERRERVRSAVRAHWHRSVALRRLRVAVWIAGSLAAAAALLVAIGLGLRHGVSPFPGSVESEATVEAVEGHVRSRTLGTVKRGDTIGAADELHTGPDGRVAIRLAGDTSLRIDSESRVELLSDSSIALHQGAVYVHTESAAERASSMEIHTPLGLVTEIGTQFEVRLEIDSMRLRVRHGLVSLKRGEHTYRAHEGQQLLAGAGGDVVMGEVPRHGEEWNWTLEIAPSFDLEGRSLDEFLGWVSSETGWSVEFEEDSIADQAPTLILHGSIEGLRPDEAPEAVLPTCGLRQRIEQGTLIVGRISENR